MNTLQAQKRLLIVESELNRAALVKECKTFFGRTGQLKQELVSSASLISLVSGAMGSWRVASSLKNFFAARRSAAGKAETKSHGRWQEIANVLLRGLNILHK